MSLAAGRVGEPSAVDVEYSSRGVCVGSVLTNLSAREP